MSEKFSPTLRLSDLNDFIAPSQACIISLKAAASKPEKAENQERVAPAVKPSNEKPTNYALCFSGCITSAETVMLEKQSLEEFISHLESDAAVVVSVSPQSRASLAAYFDLSPTQVFRKLTTFFKPEKIYHVTVMPCYDKKLEAARDDFVFSVECEGEVDNGAAGPRIAEVDSVLTSGEVLELTQLKSVDLKGLEESPLDRLLTNVDDDGHLFAVPGGSGGYADTVFRYAAKTLFGKEIKGPLNFKMLRNSDFREISLEVDGQTVLKFALCYGFRNLQNIVRKIKIRKCDYDFVEVMACPSGCLNGGGQIKPRLGQSAKDLIQSLENVYMEDLSAFESGWVGRKKGNDKHTRKVMEADPFENPLVKNLYDEWLGKPGSENAKRHIHTEYHPILKSITSQLHNWRILSHADFLASLEGSSSPSASRSVNT
ncbi:hypothetical protein ACLOJK_035715 [Asimina triloba]